MGFMEDMMALAHSSEGSTVLTGADLESFRAEYQHIADLKPGDKLKWKNEMFRDYKNPEVDKPCEVYRVIPIVTQRGEYGTNHFMDECDFTIVVQRGKSDVYEAALDSRRFVRVE